jgi:2-(1,2-epoxy-1,2-dihydrophenyl)acetyl-CoA isomerase
MNYETIIAERERGVLTISLNRPQVLNALTVRMVEETADALQQAAPDKEIRAVLMTGSGDGFCSGADLEKVDSRYEPFKPLGMKQSVELYQQATLAMLNLEKPIVGAINGVAAGAGMSVALACDIIIASEKASFIQIFVKRGLVPDCGSFFLLPRLVGMARAKEMMFTGEAVSAQEALGMGLVNRVVPHDSLMSEARALAEKLAAGPTKAIGFIKRILGVSFESSLETSLREEAMAQGLVVGGKDTVEGVSAFVQKRTPQFKGE